MMIHLLLNLCIQNSGIYTSYFFVKMMSLVFDSRSSYTSLECLTNRLPEVDCEHVVSITCDEKYSELFNTLKCPAGQCIAEVYQLR